MKFHCIQGESNLIVKTPPFSCIPLDYVIIDTLHLFSRISDNLIELLLRELRRQDAIDKKDTLANGFSREKFKHMAATRNCYRTWAFLLSGR